MGCAMCVARVSRWNAWSIRGRRARRAATPELARRAGARRLRVALSFDLLELREGRTGASAPGAETHRGSTGLFGTSNASRVRIEIKKEDLYELTGQALEDLGVDLSTVAPESLRLFTGSGVSLSGNGELCRTAELATSC
ncbi:MAG: hypothetical protein U0527_08300 [Candidatus Eisenbacteria bacterium]